MYVAEHDLLIPKVVALLEKQIIAGVYYYVHFGLPCSSFSLLQNLNGGTRTALHPEGDGSLERENIGNRLAKTVARLCRLLHSNGAYFSIENPKTSRAWQFGPIARLPSSVDVIIDQCEYNLTPPHESSQSNVKIKKPTKIKTNLHCLLQLSRACTKSHEHYPCYGSVKTAQGWVSVARAAGNYPVELCTEWARLVASSIQ